MRYLGIDFGLKRVGLAVSEGELAEPWKVVEVKGIADAVSKVLQILGKSDFNKVVVGMPEGKMAQNVLGFVRKLKAKKIDVSTFDEHLSSYQATKLLIELNVPLKKRRVNDAYSATIILQNYLDQK